MFILNLGYKWTLASVDGLRGVAMAASANPIPRVQREHPGDFHRVLFDPQLYLAGLRVEHRTKVCARLAGYPWFGVEGVRSFESATQKRRDWDAAMRVHVASAWPGQVPDDVDRAALQAVEFQVERGCTAILLPTPLVDEREDEGASIGTWIDSGISAAQELEVAQPLLATVAVSEKALNEGAFESGGILEALVDQVTARSDLDGVYIVVGQTGGLANAFEIHDNVARGYFYLTHHFAEAGVQQIILNYADLAGLVSVGLGATGFASAPSGSLRILQLDAFKDEGGGIAVPWFYSHATASEYQTETHLNVLTAHRLLRRIADETDASAPLMDALRRGYTAGTLPAWAESQNNLTAAHLHYVQRMVAVGSSLRRKKRKNERREEILDWMESAEANALLVERRTGGVGRRPPLERWRGMVETLLE